VLLLFISSCINSPILMQYSCSLVAIFLPHTKAPIIGPRCMWKASWTIPYLWPLILWLQYAWNLSFYIYLILFTKRGSWQARKRCRVSSQVPLVAPIQLQHRGKPSNTGNFFHLVNTSSGPKGTWNWVYLANDHLIRPEFVEVWLVALILDVDSCPRDIPYITHQAVYIAYKPRTNWKMRPTQHRACKSSKVAGLSIEKLQRIRQETWDTAQNQLILHGSKTFQ